MVALVSNWSTTNWSWSAAAWRRACNASAWVVAPLVENETVNGDFAFSEPGVLTPGLFDGTRELGLRASSVLFESAGRHCDPPWPPLSKGGNVGWNAGLVSQKVPISPSCRIFKFQPANRLATSCSNSSLPWYSPTIRRIRCNEGVFPNIENSLPSQSSLRMSIWSRPCSFFNSSSVTVRNGRKSAQY